MGSRIPGQSQRPQKEESTATLSSTALTHVTTPSATPRISGTFSEGRA